MQQCDSIVGACIPSSMSHRSQLTSTHEAKAMVGTHPAPTGLALPAGKLEEDPTALRHEAPPAKAAHLLASTNQVQMLSGPFQHQQVWRC